MIIKKFQGKTETEAILKAKEELGSNAVVMNIKTTKAKGIFRLFRKDKVEVTAALEEKDDIQAAPEATDFKQVLENKKDILPEPEPEIEKKEDKDIFEKKLNSIQSLLEQQMKKEEQVKEQEPGVDEKESLPFLRLVYNQLINNEVEEIFANQIIGEVEKSLKKEASLDSVLSAVYQKIILKIGEPYNIEPESGKKRVLFFIGPTGVGKTTTIAKLGSDLKLVKNAKLAFMAADTYRIAAVEQLRTYSTILDLPLKVIYSGEDLKEGLEELREYDIIFVDTAGRSHKNEEQCDELFHLIHSIPENSPFQPEICLVLSVTTKYNDLEKICKKYSEFGNYRIIFTKLDETGKLGNILNIAMLTGGRMSYTTFGQNVPDDITIIDVQSIAKQLLGGGE